MNLWSSLKKRLFGSSTDDEFYPYTATEVGDVTQRVLAGADLLDEKVPGWYNRVNLAYLDINSSRNCILGQVFGRYGNGLNALEILGGSRYGFCVPFGLAEHAHDVWRGQIVKRKVRERRANETSDG